MGEWVGVVYTYGSETIGRTTAHTRSVGHGSCVVDDVGTERNGRGEIKVRSRIGYVFACEEIGRTYSKQQH